MDAEQIVAAVAVEDPICRSQEGLHDGCFFCGACDWVQGEGLHRWSQEAVRDHTADCVWVLACQHVGKDIAPHAVMETT